MEIILYSTHCPRCTVLEKKLKSKNVEYKEINSVSIMQEIGITAVPVLSIDGELYNFERAVKWINALED